MGEAEKSRDAEFFETLLADKLTFRRANGAVVDKATFLKDLQNLSIIYHMLSEIIGNIPRLHGLNTASTRTLATLRPVKQVVRPEQKAHNEMNSAL